MLGIRRRSIVAASVALAAAIAGSPAALALAPPPGYTTSRAPAAFSASFVRGAYGKDSSATGFGVMAANGFNSVMTGPYRELVDPLAKQGLRGVVWLGNFQNGPKCAFDRDDATIAKLVKPLAGDAGVLAYYLGDEPHVSECPAAPALFKQRSELVHSLDPGSKTFTVIQASEHGIAHDYGPWAGAVDVIGFDVYPCSRASATCDFGLIDSAVAAIKSAGITMYWAIVQDFQDCYYRLPTAQEIAIQFDHWGRSAMSGYFVFSWNYQAADPKCVGVSIDRFPDNVAQLKIQNAHAFASSSAPVSRSSGPGAPTNPSLMVVLTLLAALACAGGVALMIGLRAVRAR